MYNTLKVMSLIAVLAIGLSAQAFPGTAGDFDVRVAVNAVPTSSATDVVTIASGDALFLRVLSPQQSINLAPLYVFADLTIGPPPTNPYSFGDATDLWINPAHAGFLIPLVGPSPIAGPELLIAGGNLYGFEIPVSLAPLSVIVQGLVLTSSAQNGAYELSNARICQFI